MFDSDVPARRPADLPQVAATLPPYLSALTSEVEVELPMPGAGDHEAAAARLLAARAVLTATSVVEVVVGVARFVVMMGGRLVPAAAADRSALPLDIAFGTGAPVLAEAELLSVARMRLEQFLPPLLEDARVAVARLRHIQDIERSSNIDLLTGLPTRRQLMRALAEIRAGDVVCVVDIDNFKSLNDTAGHNAGDAVLSSLGRLIIDNVRRGDFAGRYGGDELVLLLGDVSEQMAVHRLQDLQSRWLEVRPAEVTFSAGVAAVGDLGWREAMADADATMYAAKARGRNQVASHSQLQP